MRVVPPGRWTMDKQDLERLTRRAKEHMTQYKLYLKKMILDCGIIKYLVKIDGVWIYERDTPIVAVVKYSIDDFK